MKIHGHIKKRKITKAWIFVILLFLLLFSYVAGFFYQGEREVISFEEEPGQVWVEEKMFWGEKRITLEEYLMGMMAATIPATYENETLKAQAVILRSHCMSHIIHKDGRKIIEEKDIRQYYFSKKEREYYWKEEYDALQAKIKNAIDETKGKVLLHEGKIISPPFFRVGNGKTRSAKDFPVAGKEYGYIKQAECTADMDFENYITYIDVSRKDFLEKIKYLKKSKEESGGKITLVRDSTEYVKEIYLGKEYISIDEFTKVFKLPSSCFSIETINEKIQFKVTGQGHGFGFSQYQANVFAKEGKTMEELLNYFFTNITIERAF